MARTIILSIALPGIAAATLLFAAAMLARWINARGTRNLVDDLIRCICSALAFGGGFLLCFELVEGLPTLPPRERWHWLAIMAVTAAGIGALHGLYARHAIGRLSTALLLGVAAAWLLQPLPAITQPLLLKLALGAGVAVLWHSSDALARRQPGHFMPLVMMLTFTAASIVLIESRSVKFGQTAASLACMSGAAMVIALIFKRANLAGGAIAVLAMLLPAWLVTGWMYDYEADLPEASFLVIAAAPLAPWLTALPRVKSLSSGKRWLLQIAAVLALCAAGVVLALLMAAPPPEPYVY